MISPFRHEVAVSETIGAVLLISIVVVAVAVVAAILWSQPAPQKIPAFSASITNASCSVILAHSGGETVTNTTISILIDGADQTANFIKQGSAGPWESWGIGETLVYTPSIPCILAPQRVDVIYTYGAGRNLLFSVYLENPLSGNFTPRPPVPPAIADFSANTTSGLSPLAVQFTDTSTGSPLAWNWTFGDGETSLLQHPAHTYSGANSYTVSLTVDNGTGVGTNTKVVPDYITVHAPPLVADFSGTPLSGQRPLAVSFTDSSTGSPTGWNWTFGDIGAGNTSTMQNPSHTYVTHGRYTVNLTVTNASSSHSTMIKTNYITVTPNPPWYSCSWSYRKNITIDHTKVSGTQNNFPVLINLASDADLSASARSDGYDILFTSSDGTTKIPHEIEQYTSGSGALVAWVNVSAITSSADTTIFMYYGNPTSANQQNQNAVWDANFRGVWHLKEDPSGAAPQMQDSTSNARHGTSAGAMTTSDQVPAMINGGLDFDGSNDEITSAMDAITTEITVEAWASTSSNGVVRGIVNKEISTYTGYLLRKHSDNTYRFATGSPTTAGQYAASNTAYTDSNWHHIVGVRRSGTNYLYIDGVQQTTTFTRAITDSGANFDIGRSYSNYNGYWWSGGIDEVRISNTGRSSFWIATEYNNQNSPSTFYSVGNQEQWTC
jgi:PKD repeat protein